jgi:hypothetical protein
VSRQITADHIDQPYLFRTYDHESSLWPPKNPGKADDYEIWEVAQATTAAPTYFKAARLKDPANPNAFVEYTDGGVRNNNPSLVAYDEVVRKEKFYEGPKDRHPILLLLSIGSGQFSTKSERLKQKLTLLGRLLKWLKFSHFRDRKYMLARLRNALTDPEETVDTVRLRMEGDARRPYFRWTGGTAIAGLKLDFWKEAVKPNEFSTAQIIEASIMQYVAHDKVREEMDCCAHALVERRRKRVQDRDKWIRFAHCTTIRCPYCPHETQTRYLLKQHIENAHPSMLDDFNDGALETFVSRLPLTYPTIPGGPL